MFRNSLAKVPISEKKRIWLGLAIMEHQNLLRSGAWVFWMDNILPVTLFLSAWTQWSGQGVSLPLKRKRSSWRDMSIQQVKDELCLTKFASKWANTSWPSQLRRQKQRWMSGDTSLRPSAVAKSWEWICDSTEKICCGVCCLSCKLLESGGEVPSSSGDDDDDDDESPDDRMKKILMQNVSWSAA
jgi:hypothetical protein